MLSSIIFGAAIFTAVCLIWSVLTDPLRGLPGPFLARWTDWWYFRKVWKGDFERTNKSLHEEYGSIVRYGPGRYSIDDTSAIDLIYGHSARMAKSPWYSSWSPPPPLFGQAPSRGQVPLFADRSIERHAQNRKVFQSTYSMSNLINYESYVDDCADIFIQRLQEVSQSELDIDIRQWFQFYAFDVIGMITYGKKFGFLEKMQDLGGVITALSKHTAYATLVGIFPSLHPVVAPLADLLSSGKRFGRQYLVDFTRDRVGEHLANPKASAEMETGEETQSFLSKFFAKHASNPEDFTRGHIIAGCVSNIVAGAETTATMLTATLYFLLKNPGCLKRCHTEISQAKSAAKLSERPAFKESQEMPYIQAVIKESLRVHALAGLPLERVVPEGGVTIKGQYFPQGTTVGVSMWLEHFNTSVFGDDADDFRPERWLIDDADQLKLMNHHWMPFGLGSRTCIGRHIAILEMSKLLPRVLEHFEFELSRQTQQEGEVWRTLNMWFVEPAELKVRVRPRSKLY